MRDVHLCTRDDGEGVGVCYQLNDEETYSVYCRGFYNDVVIEFTILHMYSIFEDSLVSKIPILYSNVTYELECREDYYMAIKGLEKKREKICKKLPSIDETPEASGIKYLEQQLTAVRYKINTLHKRLGLL